MNLGVNRLSAKLFFFLQSIKEFIFWTTTIPCCRCDLFHIDFNSRNPTNLHLHVNIQFINYGSIPNTYSFFGFQPTNTKLEILSAELQSRMVWNVTKLQGNFCPIAK
jgi:hypothetical protein